LRFNPWLLYISDVCCVSAEPGSDRGLWYRGFSSGVAARMGLVQGIFTTNVKPTVAHFIEPYTPRKN